MATLASAQPDYAAADGFYRKIAIWMAITVVIGFSLQFLMGRSTFAARALVHVHGVTFMTWVGIFVTQAWLATRGPIAMHRTLGRIAAGWVLLMVIMGCWISIDVTQRGIAPFFFKPQHFLIANPMGVFVFAGLVWTAIAYRKQTDWHMRLQISAMAAIMGPAFGRILPMPLLIPYAFDIAVLAGLIFPVIGMVRDKRRYGAVHKAWWIGIIAVVAVLPVAHLIAYSPIGDAIYASVTAGHPGANVPGLEFAPPPPMPG